MSSLVSSFGRLFCKESLHLFPLSFATQILGKTTTSKIRSRVEPRRESRDKAAFGCPEEQVNDILSIGFLSLNKASLTKALGERIPPAWILVSVD